MLTETPGSRFRHLQPLGALERAFFIYTTSSFGKSNQGDIDELDRQLASWIDKKTYRSLPSRWQWVRLRQLCQCSASVQEADAPG